MEDIKKRQQEIEQKEREKNRKDAVRCDWDNPDDVAALRSIDTADRRIALLNKLVPDRVCSKCKEFNEGHWVIISKRKIICRSCHFMRDRVIEPVETKKAVFRAVERYVIDSKLLFVIRKQSGVSQRHLAALAGWSRSYQQRLENGSCATINKKNKLSLLKVFKRLKIGTADTK